MIEEVIVEKLGQVIILNGTSSSGKSTLARELQSKLNHTFSGSKGVYLVVELDAFWNMTPYRIPAGSTNFPNIKRALFRSVRGLIETGHNVIVDVIFCARKTYQELSDELAGIDYMIVKVNCPIEELKKREKDRGDRQMGLAESQINSVHSGTPYDIEIDTSIYSPSESAQIIIRNIQ